jgi:LuxR family maltose regulon positive regulatory protein
LHHVRAVCAFHQFDFDVLVREMEAAAAGYETQGQRELAGLTRAHAAVGLLNSGRHDEARDAFRRLHAEPAVGGAAALTAYFMTWMAYADHEPAQAAPAFARALHWLERTADPRLWEQCFMQCFLAGLPGMTPLLQRFDACAMRLTEDTPSVLRASLLHTRATLACGAGDLQRAAQWMAAADEDLRWLGSPRALATENMLLHLAVDALRGDAAAVEHHGRRWIDDMRESGEANRRTHLNSGLMMQARAWWFLREDERLRAVAADMAQARNDYEWRYAEHEQAMVRGMVALAEGRDAEAEALLQAAVVDDVDDDILFFRNSHARLMLAEAQRRCGALDRAAATLRPWLQSARGGGFVGGALLAGRRVLEPLAKANWEGRLALADITLLQRVRDTVGAQAATPQEAAARPGGLSEREWEVLELIAAGESNKHIARVLDLSLFTVKRHVANIFNKLSFSSRTQAAVWLRGQR